MSLFRWLPSIVSHSRHYLHSPVVRAAIPRYFSTSITLPPDIDFEELRKRLEADEITLIDVRMPTELKKFGMIPKSKNIMVQTLGPDILLPEDEFAEKFGFKKPALDEPLVTTCLLGIRARTAQLAMMTVGYKNVRVYVGSFEDWLEKGGPVEYPEPKPEN